MSAAAFSNWERAIRADLALLEETERQLIMLNTRKAEIRARVLEAMDGAERKSYNCPLGRIDIQSRRGAAKVVNEATVPATLKVTRDVIDSKLLAAALALGDVPGIVVADATRVLKVSLYGLEDGGGDAET